MPKPILVFDSGMGGLSVLQQIKQLLPHREYCYLFDNARLPYGELEEQRLIEGCVELVVSVATKIDAAIVVIACNTASTLVLEVLRSRLTIPVVGVVPAIKPAASLSKAKHIGLLATPGTIRRDYTHNLIKLFAHQCKVELIGSSELVLMAEQKMAGQAINMARLRSILSPIVDLHLDVLVLGCTHFPLLTQELNQILGQSVTLLDSGEAIAKRVLSLLKREGNLFSEATLENKPVSSAMFTSKSLSTGLLNTLAAYDITAINSVSTNG